MIRSKRSRLVLAQCVMAGVGVLGMPNAHAVTEAIPIGSFLQLSGQLRAYQFNKNYTSSTKTDQSSSAYGAIVRITTRPFLGGFGAGLGFYSAHAIATFHPGDKAQETTLMGSGSSLNTVGEAYLQYRNSDALLRGGRQIIKSPWMSARDSRMLPQTFEGVWGHYKIMPGLQIQGGRVTRFKSRDSVNFYKDNLYYPKNYNGDEMYGTTTVLPASAAQAPGTTAVGVQWKNASSHAQIWYYDFTDFAKTWYADAGYVFGAKSKPVRPFVDAQLMTQSGSGNNNFVLYNAALLKHKGGVKSNLWGARAGIKLHGGAVYLAYNHLANEAGALGGGALISPYGNYTAMYAASMTADLLKFGPGSAWKLAGEHYFFAHRLKLLVAALSFNTQYDNNQHSYYVDAAWHFDGKLKGLILRDRLAVDSQTPASSSGTLYYNRLMMQYRF